MKKIIFWIISLAVLIVLPVWAADGATFKNGQDYYLGSADQVNDNLYAAGVNVNIAGIVNGDLSVAGASIFISGPVLKDFSAIGSMVSVNGNIVDDARVAGGNVTVGNSVGGDLMAAGGQLNILPGTAIGRDAWLAGGMVNYNGDAKGNVKIAGGRVYVNGSSGKSLVVRGENVVVGPNAVIRGNFDYYAPKEARIESGAKIAGTTNFHKMETPIGKRYAGGALFGILTTLFLVKFLIMAASALLIFYFFKNQLKNLLREIESNFWKETGRGFAVMILLPVAAVISLITVLGAVLGAVAGLAYVAMIAVSCIIAPILFTSLAVKYIFKKPETEMRWWTILLGILGYQVICLVPLLGGLFCLIIFLASFGGFSKSVFYKIRA